MNPEAEELYRLELALAQRDEASIDGGFAAVLDPEFAEIGQSGRWWTRAETLAMIASEAPTLGLSIEGYEGVSLADGVTLVTYDLVAARSDGSCARSRRSSIWLPRDGRWLLRFHQGTPVPGQR